MRLILLNRFYWPDEPATAQLLTDLAEALAARGCEVTIITSHPGGPTVPRAETHRGVRILRVGSTRSTGAGLRGKAMDFATFFLGALGRLLVTARRGDAIVAMTDPPLLGIGVAFVAALRGARLFHWVQDIYPELAIELTGHGWLHLVRPMRNVSWRSAEGCVTLGDDMAAELAAAGVAPERISVIPNWGPAGLTAQPASAAASLRAEWGLAGKFVVAYSGNLGRVHDLDAVLDLADAMRADRGVAFVLIGGGAQRVALETAAARRGLSNLTFHPPQPRAQLAASLALGDLHLVTLRPGCERFVFPSKLYGITAVGRPVLLIGPRDCELARLVRERGFGRAFARDEIDALAGAVRALAQNPAECARLAAAALDFAAENGGPTAAAERWQRVLNPAQAC